MTTTAKDFVGVFTPAQATKLGSTVESKFAPIIVSVAQQNYGGTNYATYTSATCKAKYVISADCSDIVLTYNSLLAGTVVGTPEVLPGNNFELKASIELSNGTLIPVWFGTNRLVLMKPGVALKSNVVGVELAEGETIYVRTFINRIISNVYTDNVGETGNLTANLTNLINGYSARGAVFANGEGVTFSAATGVDPFLTDLTDSSTIAESNNVCFGPVCIEATPKAKTSKSVAIIGDSISAGSGDNTAPAGSVVNTNFDQYPYGYWSRLFGANGIACLRLAQGGEQISEWLTNVDVFYRQALINNPTAVVALGTNDIVTGGASADTIQANLTLLVAKLKKYFDTIYVATILPRATSTDGFTTLANQTTVTTNNFDVVKTAVNTWLRGGNLKVPIIDVAAIGESSLNSGKWVPGAILATGTATGGSATTIVDAGQSWTVNQWYGYVCTNLATGQTGFVASNTATTLTCAFVSGITQFSPVPGVGNAYSISASYTGDGTHPSSFGYETIANAIPATAFGA